jgi:hypothetical protein
MKSTEFLQAAIDVQAERGKQYDKPTGERSMAATVSAFNCITGSMLEESDGWLILSLLKLVRQAQNPDQYHHDSALDFVAYASLYAEAASEQCGQLEEKEVASAWLEWNGDDSSPVAKGVLVDVRYTDGDEAYSIPALTMGDFKSRDGDPCGAEHWHGITAYRLSPTSTAK